MNSYQCVIFDLDGTLVDSHAYTFAAFRFACAPYCESLSDEQIYASFGPDEHVILRRLAGEENADAAFARLQEHYRTHLTDLKLDARIVRVLESCHAAGLRRGLFTGRGMSSTRMILEHLGWQSTFDAVVAGDTVQSPKPSGQGIVQILQSLDVMPEGTLVVGDSSLDLLAAEDAGTDALLATWFARGVTQTRSAPRTAQSPVDVLTCLGLREPSKFVDSGQHRSPEP